MKTCKNALTQQDIGAIINLRKRKNEKYMEGGQRVFNKNKFKAQLALSGITAKELSQKLGIDESTLYRKINEEGRFSRQEINTIIEVLNIENPMEIFFAEKLA